MNQRVNCSHRIIVSLVSLPVEDQSYTADQQRSTITATSPERCSQDASSFETPKSSVLAMPNSNRESDVNDESD